jgi:hypothetical protein
LDWANAADDMDDKQLARTTVTTAACCKVKS